MIEMAFAFGASVILSLAIRGLTRRQRQKLAQLAHEVGGTLIRGALHAQHEGIDYRLRISSGQDAPSIISVVCPDAGRLRITRRKRIDRLEAWLPHTELSYGNPRFQERYLVQTRDLALGRELLADSEVRAAVDELFAEGANALHVDGIRVKATSKPRALGKPPAMNRLVTFLLPLARIGQAVERVAQRGLPLAPRRDPLVVASWAVLLTATLLGLVSAVIGLEVFDPVEPWPIVLTGLALGWMGAALTAVVLVPLLARRSSPGRTLLPMLALAVFTLPFTGIGAVASANGLLDQGLAEVFTGLPPESVSLRRREQARDVTRVVVNAPRHGDPLASVSLTLDFPASIWPRWGQDARVWVELRPGALGHPWLADYGVTGLDAP